jgi:GT2 family glycosyltransferase
LNEVILLMWNEAGLSLSMQTPLENKLTGLTTPRLILHDISVVIPTLGRPILEESLSRFAIGSVWPCEIIVVDQSSSQQVVQWLEKLQLAGLPTRYVPSKQRGRSAGLNRGLELVRTNFVAITDDDCFVDEHWLEKMAQKLHDHPASIVTGRVEAAGEGTLITVTSPTPAVYTRPRLKFDSMSGGNLGTSQAVLQQVGLFDEDLRLATAEDAEWSYRALRKGIAIVYEPDIVVHHFGWRNQEGLSRQFAGYARSHGGFYGKYIRKGDGFIMLRALLHHYRALRWWVRGRASKDKDLALTGKAYFTGLMPGILVGIRKEPERKIAA